MIAIGAKLLSKIIMRHASKFRAPKYFSKAKVSLKKELLNKEAYKRYVLNARQVSKHSGQKPVSYPQYKASIKDALDKTPTGLGFGKGKWGGMFTPRELVRYRHRFSEKVTERLFPGRYKKMRDYGRVRVKPSVIGRDMIQGRQDIGVHELKHAIQANIRRSPTSSPLSALSVNKYISSILKKGWNKPINMRKGTWKHYNPSDVPIELSARASTLRAYSPELLKKILKDPKKYRHINEVNDIGLMTGFGKGFRNYMDKAWALLPGGLLTRAMLDE